MLVLAYLQLAAYKHAIEEELYSHILNNCSQTRSTDSS